MDLPSDDQTPRLSFSERRQARMQARIEKWEARRAGPPPPVYVHRVIIMAIMMLLCLWLVYLITVGPA